MTTSCARSRAPSFTIAWLTWVRAVAGLRNSSAPISSLLSPCPTRASTSRSRWVSTASRSSAARVTIRSAVNWAMRRRVIRGASNASPAATTRMACNSSAGPASLSRKPLAPAWRALKTYTSVSYVVRISTRTCSRPRVRTISLVAWIPSNFGMRMSMSTTSGRVARARSTASAPLAASPTTLMSSSASSSTLNPDRPRTWSSASSTLIGVPPDVEAAAALTPSPRYARRWRSPGTAPVGSLADARSPRHGFGRGQRQPGIDLEPAARPRPGGQLSAQKPTAFAHSDDPTARLGRTAVDSTGRWPRTPGVITRGIQATLVGHPDLQDVGSVVQRDRHPRRPDVADHVGDRLLQDPVGGVVHRARQRRRGRPHLEFDIEAGLARHRRELVDLCQSGLRHPPVARVTKHSEDRPHLVQRLGAGLLDRQQRPARPFRLLVEQVRGDAGLYVDDRDGVGDGVVYLARDPQALGVDPRTRLLLPGPFRLPGTLQRFGRDDPPGADRLAQGSGQDRRRDPEEHPSDGGPRLDVGRGDEPADGQHGDTRAGDHQRPAPVAVGGERVQGDEEPDRSGPVREVDGVVHQAGESGRHEH